jgi:hypothetical protein
VSKKRKRGTYEQQQEEVKQATADVTGSTSISAELRQFMQAPTNFSQKEAQKRRKAMGPFQFSQH